MPRQASGSSSATASSSPRTLLPQNPSSLAQYLHNQQLLALRKIYEKQALSAVNPAEQEIKSRRAGGADLTAATGKGSGAAGRRARQQRRSRRGSGSPPPLGSEEGGDDTGDAGAELEHWNRRKKMRLTATLEHAGGDSNIDRAHAYEMLYDLSPNGSSDASVSNVYKAERQVWID
jgi:hypothetical protein